MSRSWGVGLVVALVMLGACGGSSAPYDEDAMTDALLVICRRNVVCDERAVRDGRGPLVRWGRGFCRNDRDTMAMYAALRADRASPQSPSFDDEDTLVRLACPGQTDDWRQETWQYRP